LSTHPLFVLPSGIMAGNIHHYTLRGSLYDHFMGVEIYISSHQAIGDWAMVLTNYNYNILTYIVVKTQW